jgi:2OG-Fe(II) oxygenase superfamily
MYANNMAPKTSLERVLLMLLNLGLDHGKSIRPASTKHALCEMRLASPLHEKAMPIILGAIIFQSALYAAVSFSGQHHLPGPTMKFREQGRIPLLRFASSKPLNPDKIESELRSLGIDVTKQPIEVLSSDPLLFVVHGFLSPQECQAYRDYASSMTTTARAMTRSNPPEVSLAPGRLWPLPILAVLSGLPPLLRLYESARADVTPAELLGAVLPPIVLATVVMATLAWLVVLPLVRKFANTSSRTSVACALNQVEDLPWIDALLQRSCVVAQHERHHWEAPVVTRYDPGAIFARHGDASPTRGSEWKGLGGQRIVTCITYLNTLKRSGETYFDQLNIVVQPTMGSALFFFPADATTWRADDRTTHESLPVAANEEKWIVQLFGRVELVPPPLGLPTTTMFDQSTPTSSSSSSTAVATGDSRSPTK